MNTPDWPDPVKAKRWKVSTVLNTVARRAMIRRRMNEREAKEHATRVAHRLLSPSPEMVNKPAEQMLLFG